MRVIVARWRVAAAAPAQKKISSKTSVEAFVSNFELISARKTESRWLLVLFTMSNRPQLGTFRVCRTNSTSFSAFDGGISMRTPKMSHAYHSADRTSLKKVANWSENFGSNGAKKRSILQNSTKRSRWKFWRETRCTIC